MKRVRRITAGRGSVSLSERTTRSKSASTISAFPSITSRSARRIGTIVNGSNEEFSARQPTIKHSSSADLPKYTSCYTTTIATTPAVAGNSEASDRRCRHVPDALAGNGATRGSSRLTLWNGRQPTVPIFERAAGNPHVLTLDGKRQRARLSGTHRDSIHRADGRDLCRRACEEQLIGDVQHLARDRLLDDFNPHVPGNTNHRIAGDSIEDTRADRRSEQLPIAHEEQVF